MKKVRGVLSEKEKLSLLVKKVAKKCVSLEELATKLREQQLKPYYRKELLSGIWLGKRKLRLTTLGVDKSHLKALTKEQKRLDSLRSKQQNLRRDRER